LLNLLTGKIRRATLNLLAALLVSALLPPCPAKAHSDQPPEHRHEETAKGGEGAAGIGIDEHLGAKIPLDLTFHDETGKPVRLRELITGPTIILPVYFSCTNICNFLQSGLASVLPAVKRKPGEEYRVISVSFDETETPELATRYKKTYLSSINAAFPADGWRFLTGDLQNIHRLTAAAGYRFKRQGRDFIHPVASFVTSGDGTIVRYLYGTTFLPKDLTLALLEAQEGKVGTTIRKVVGYCFTFDPAGKTYVFNLLRVSATVVILCVGGFLAFLLLTSKKGKS
jgi:protein SCO1/2